MWGRFGEVVLHVDREGRWWVKLREGTREVTVHGASDSRNAQAVIAKFMSAMAALASRGANVAEDYAIDAAVQPRAPLAGEVVALSPRCTSK